MKEMLQKFQERNQHETLPFVPVYKAYTSLLLLSDTLQDRCRTADQEIQSLRQELQDGGGDLKNGSKASLAALQSALKNETRLRDKLEKLQEEYNAKLKAESDVKTEALKTSSKLQEVQELNAALEKELDDLKEVDENNKVQLLKTQQQVEDAQSATKLAETQYEGLKKTIRTLQEENDELKKENRLFEQRLVSEKTKMVDEVSTLTDMVQSLKKEVDMLRQLKKQEEERQRKNGGGNSPKRWFGGSASSAPTKEEASNPERKNGPKFGTFGVVVPSLVKHTLEAHKQEATYIRYDDSGTNCVVTSSCDSSVKVWDTTHATLLATLRGSVPVLCCDMMAGLVVGGSTDKTCRVWNVKTERMIHQLVGHQQKINAVRLFHNGKSVLTGSADRSLKIWDISRRTYRQTSTLRHSSSLTCLDVASDSVTAVSGHVDGGLRFWDLHQGSRIADTPHLHDSGLISVQCDVNDASRVLTNGLDRCLKVVDVRSNAVVRNVSGDTAGGWSRAVWSPDSRYVLAGSSRSGVLCVWDAGDGRLVKTLDSGHGSSAVVGVDWVRNGSGGGGQQVASLDRKGKLILWA